MRKFLKAQLCYPKQALAESLEGTVYLKYTINHLGKVIEARIISGLGAGCDEEAVRIVKLLKFEVPKNRKMKVLFHRNIQIHFRLPKKTAKKAAPESAPGIRYEFVPTEKKTDDQPPKSGNSGYSYTIEW